MSVSTIIYVITGAFALAFFYLVLSPYLSKKMLNKKVPLMRRRPLILDERIGSLCEPVEITQLASDKFLFHLWDGVNHFKETIYAWELFPLNNVQACVGNTPAVWKVLRGKKNAHGVEWKRAFEELKAENDMLEREKTLLKQDKDDEIDISVDRVVALEKSRGTGTGQGGGGGR